MPDDHFEYDQLMLDAHRELIRKVLLKVAKTGLPGDHHFFIIFDTTHPGARISDRLRAQYPEEMTIVLQHQYSNLSIHEERFEIQLSFNRIPELLVIPFEAITGFVDPSVPFGLQLAGDPAAGLENSIGMLVPGLPQMSQSDDAPINDRPEPGDHADEDRSSWVMPEPDDQELHEEADMDRRDGDDTSVPSVFASLSSVQEVISDDADHAPLDESSENLSEDGDDDDEPENANIVQLDAFRKKSK